MWKNYNYWNDTWFIKTIKGKVLINGIEIEKRRVELLDKLNFISPYIELPKKLTVKAKFNCLW